jgi:hypothetical protein
VTYLKLREYLIDIGLKFNFNEQYIAELRTPELIDAIIIKAFMLGYSNKDGFLQDVVRQYEHLHAHGFLLIELE